MDELFKSCDKLIYSIASKFYNVEKEDLIQAGQIGLINAYNHYDKNSKTKFSTFAYTYIFGEMYNLSINSKIIKNNKDTLKLVKKLEKAKNYLTQKLNKIPTLKDLSDYLNIDEFIISNAYLSVNAILSIDSDEDNSIINEMYVSDDNDLKLDIKNSINTLDKEEKDVIRYRYYNDLTQSEVAKILNMSQVSVSRCEKKTLQKLKKVLTC